MYINSLDSSSSQWKAQQIFPKHKRAKARLSAFSLPLHHYGKIVECIVGKSEKRGKNNRYPDIERGQRYKSLFLQMIPFLWAGHPA